jgi:hypothetical protein
MDDPKIATDDAPVKRGAKPLPEDVFVCRWRDWLATVVDDPARAAAFARHMHGLADKLDIELVFDGMRPRHPGRRT